MRKMQDRAAGRFIHAARFHADVAVLHHVHPPDAVFAAELVQRLHHAERRKLLAVHGHAIAFHEIERDEFRFVRRVFGKHRERGECSRDIFCRSHPSTGLRECPLRRKCAEDCGPSKTAFWRWPARESSSSRNTRSFPRDREIRSRKRASRHGAMTCKSGASAAAVSSNRTWSLPLPVAPWAMASRLFLARDLNHALWR